MRASWDVDQTIDTSKLSGVLDQPKETVWSGVAVGPQDSFDGIWLRLTATDSRTCRIAAARPAVDSGLCTPAIPPRSPALAEGDSLAYLAIRRVEEGKPKFELGAIGHGENGVNLARQLCDEIESWDQDRTAQPVIRAYRAGTSNSALALGTVIDKAESRLVIRSA